MMQMEADITLLRIIYETESVTIWKGSKQGKDCVVKVFRPKDLREVNSVKSEAHKMQGVDHPCIAKIEDCIMKGQGNEVSEVWLVIEYFPKGDLQKLIDSKSKQNSFWSEKQLCQYFHQLIDALAYLESMGLAHRDIKPQNIFVSQSENLVIGDLGSLKKNSEDFQTIAGTPLYLSPALRQCFMQFQGGVNNGTCRHDPIKSDVYSLGLTFLQMASLKGVLDLTNLGTMEQKIYDRINELQYTNWTKLLLWEMLQVDENQRPTFTQLIQKHFGGARVNFQEQSPISSSQPTQEPTEPDNQPTVVYEKKISESLQIRAYTKGNSLFKELHSSSLEGLNLLDQESKICKALSSTGLCFAQFCDYNISCNQGSTYVGQLEIEYYPRNLMGDIQQRAQNGQPYDQSYLEYVFFEIAKAIIETDKHDDHQIDLNPWRVMLTPENKIKLASGRIHQREFKESKFYMDPEFSREPTGYCPKKAKVYNLGLTILQMYSLETQPKALAENIQASLQRVGDGNFRSILANMLDADFKQRPSLEQILIQIYIDQRGVRSQIEQNAFNQSGVLPEESKAQPYSGKCIVCSIDLPAKEVKVLECCANRVHVECFNARSETDDNENYYFKCFFCRGKTLAFTTNLFNCDKCQRMVEAEKLVAFNCNHSFCYTCCTTNRDKFAARKCLTCESKLPDANFQAVSRLLQLKQRVSLTPQEWENIKKKTSEELKCW